MTTIECAPQNDNNSAPADALQDDEGSLYVPLPDTETHTVVQLVPDPAPPSWKMVGVSALTGLVEVIAAGLVYSLVCTVGTLMG